MVDKNNSIYRSVVVSFRGTYTDVETIIEIIHGAIEDVDVNYYGCNSCGCPTRTYSPLETQPCEDELCGHDCEECGCFLEEEE